MKIDITLPKSWSELSDRQLKQVFRAVSSGLPGFDIRLLLAMRWARIKYIYTTPEGNFFVEIDKRPVILSPEEMHSIASALDWMDAIPEFPVRQAYIRGKAADPMLHDMTFEQYITLDNLFQGFLASNDDRLLDRMHAILYDCRISPAYHMARLFGIRLKEWQRKAVFYWFSSVKTAMARKYSNFLRQGAGKTEVTASLITKAVDAQLRALTKGDITKESQVRSMPCHRALTELDALAKEAEDFRRAMKKN